MLYAQVSHKDQYSDRCYSYWYLTTLPIVSLTRKLSNTQTTQSLYVHGKNVKEISKRLSEDLDALSKWFHKNELVMNLKKGKTEALLFGTPQKVSKYLSDFEIDVNDTKITVTKSYKYLGIPVDSSLNMNTFFDKCYKKASTRLNLLSKLRQEFDLHSAKSIYHSMILPTFTYCGIHLLHLTNTKSRRLDSFHRRAENVVNKQAETGSTINHQCKQETCLRIC